MFYENCFVFVLVFKLLCLNCKRSLRVLAQNFITRPSKDEKQTVGGETSSSDKRGQRIDGVGARAIDNNRARCGKCLELEPKQVEGKVHFDTGAPDVL